MNVSSTQAAALQAVQNAQPASAAQAKLQMLLLKKILEVQQQEADAVQKMVDGKGSIVDLRV